MRVKLEDFKFDPLVAAAYANPDARAFFKPGPDGYHFQWKWEGGEHELFIEREKLKFPDLILERLFDAAIEMAKK
ncbi:hypothetical protein [Pantoea latae]|uniref:Uncharacterized protein n=1 Tax=Pantoea latae TaxID=1964541 RepID=A0A1V9DJ93_9GAMM|nr:hypothetical protein [Pantoea latae]OQP33918.1 hypothetical protein B2J69_10080 [Pantoea latae]